MQKFKINQYTLLSVILAALSVCITSCLKETSHPPLYGWDTPNVISFQDNGGSTGAGAGFGSTTTPYPSYNFSFKLQNDTAGFDAIVIYGPKGPAPEDITVNVEANAAALDSFNNANGTSYTAPDPSVYSFPASVVIAKGQSQAYVHVTITASSTFDFNASYALPLKITSASSSTVSPNMGSEINIFGVQNQYDGIYLGSGNMVHPSYPGDYTDQEEVMTTSGPNSVTLYPLNTTVSFGVDVQITVDPNTNRCTLTCPSGAVVLDPYDPAKNYYDPAAKTFHLDFGYSGGTRHITMTAVYSGPR